MIVGSIINRVAQALVCISVLAGITVCAGTAAREISIIAHVSKTQGGRGGHVVSPMISVSGEYCTAAQMHSPHGYPETIEDFWKALHRYLEIHSEESLDVAYTQGEWNGIDIACAMRKEEGLNVVEAAQRMLDQQGELYFENYREEEIKVISNIVYDDIEGHEYRQYGFFLPDQPQPRAQIYINMDGHIYGCRDRYFWTNNAQAAQMPGFHSCVEEGKRRISEYLEIASPGVSYEIVYKGLGRKEELDEYMQVLHYSVWERQADGGSRTWEAYVEKRLNHGYDDCFYAELEENYYEKRQLCTWESEDGHFYSFAFSIAFQIEQDGGWRCKGTWEAVMMKDGTSWENFDLDTGSCDWHEVMVIDDYNFDNNPDIANIWGMPANWGGRSTSIYVRDGEGEYHVAGIFPDVPSRAADIRTIYDFSRGGYGDYFQNAYRYRDGRFVCIGSLEEKFMEDNSIEYTVRDEAGNEEVYRDELPDKWKELWN